MSLLKKDRQLVREAAMHLIAERGRFDRQTVRLREGFDRYRPALLLGGGFAMGVLLGRKQFVQATRSLASMTSLGFNLMRSSLGSMIVAATFRKAPRSSQPVPGPAQAQS